MTKPTVRIHNTQTGKVIDREMTDTEYNAYELEQANDLIRKADLEAKTQARAAILDKLGITADEAAILLG